MMIKNLVRKLSSFTYLNITQFLGALNDNIFKLLIVYFFIDIEGIENSATILSITSAIFVLPFLLFSATSGTLADRFSKRNIIVSTKIFELVIMSLGVLAFYYQSKFGCYFILFLLATQSAVFGPCKYGILPEIVATEKISSANGLMTSFTFLAIILGTFLASFILDVTGKAFLFSAIFCTVVSLVGMITSFCIEYTQPAGSSKRFNIRFISEIMHSLKIARKEPSLLAAVFGSAFFLFQGAFVQLNMIPFAVQNLGLTDIQGGYLFLLTALGIGTGAFVAGRISGKMVELALTPFAGVAVVICCYWVDAASDTLYAAVPLVMLLGFFGGVWAIPLDSYIQVASPNKYRGQIVAATNFLSFLGVLIASGLMFLIHDILGLKADKGFSIIGTLTLGMTAIIGYQFFDYITRFVGMTLSRLHFRLDRQGIENIPNSPAIYVCTHRAWNDTLLILGSQRRRMRFFVENEQYHSKWIRRLYGLLRVVFIPPIEPLENNQYCLEALHNSLNKGFSVCIFVDNENVTEEIEKLKQSFAFKEILKETEFPVIAINLRKGIKDKQPRFFTKLLDKVHVPATVSFGPVYRNYVNFYSFEDQ